MKKVKGKKKIIITATVITVALGAICYQQINAYYQHIPSVKTVSAQRGSMVTSISAQGVIVPKEQVLVQSKIAGTIKEIFVKDGDTVRKDDVLMVIDNASINAQIQQAEAALFLAEANKGKLNSGTVRSAIETAKANLEQAEIALSEAERNLSDAKILYEEKVIPRVQFELTESQYKRAKIAYNAAQEQAEIAKTSVTRQDVRASDAQIAQANAALDMALEQSQNTTVKAPILGTVDFGKTSSISSAIPYAQAYTSTSNTSLQIGTTVAPGMVLMSITNPETYQIKAYVDEINIKDIYLNQSVEITGDALTGETLKGSISRISNNTVNQGGLTTVEVIIDIQNSHQSVKEPIDSASLGTKAQRHKGTEGIVNTAESSYGYTKPATTSAENTKRHDSFSSSLLKIGSNVDVEIITNYKSNTLTVPAQTIINEGNDKYVYVTESHSPPRARLKKITTGLTNENSIEILDGISEGEQVILDGKNLKDGMRIKTD